MNDSLSSVGSAATPDTSGAPHPAINPNLSALAQLTANLSAAISSGAASGGLPSLLPLLSALPAAPLSLQTLIQNLQNGTLSIGNVAAAASPAAATASGAASPRLPVKLESASDSDGSSAPENENSASTSQPLLALSDIKPVTLSSSEPGGAGDSKATSGGERDEAASPPPLAGQSASTEKAIVNQLIRESERVVNGCRVYECRYCGKVYDIAASMRYHMRIIHLRAHLQHARTQCKRCGKHFTSVSAVNRHERICGTLGVAASGSSASGAPTQAPVSPTLPDETAAAAGKSSGPDALNVSPSTNGVASTSNASLSLPTLTPLSSLASSLLSGGLNSDSPFHAMLKQVVQQGLARASEAAASATTTAAAQSSEGTSMNASVSASANAATGDDAAAVNGSVAGSEASDESDEAEADGSENEQELKITDGAGAALASAAH